ncbi:hypothetical protein Tco_1286873 [Tanacetum coccineum]
MHFLEKPTKSEGFEEIVDFLNANPIKYALTVNPAIYCSCVKQFWDTIKAKTINGEVQLQALVDKKKVVITEFTIRRDLQLEDANGVDCLPNAIIFEQLTLIGKSKRKDTEIPQSSGPTEPIADEAANEENVPTHSNDPLLSGEDSLKLNELMELCTNLQKKVLDLETSKTTHALEIESLKRRVKKLEKKQSSRTHKLRRLYKVGLSAKVVSSDDEASLGDQEDASKQGRKILDIVVDEDITLDSTHFDIDPDMFGVHDLHGDEVFVEIEEPMVNTATTTSTIPVSAAKDLSDVDITLAQALAELKNTKLKAVTTTTTTTGILLQDPSKTRTTTTTPIPSNIKDKGKAKMVEPEKPLKKKEQIRLDEELSLKLQAEEEEQARLARKKAAKDEKANISWDNMQAMIEADRLLAERLQAREQEELTDEEKARLFVELLEKRKKHFAALRTQEKRNKPPTKAQNKSTMSTYLKHIAGYKQNEAETAQESSSKTAGDELEQEKEKKQKIDDDQEEYRENGKEGKISLFQIKRANGSSKRYSSMIQMLKDFEREDLETLWKLVKAKHGSTRPEEGYERVLWGDLRTMFQDMHLFMLVKKRYPLTPATITKMLNKKLQTDHLNEMCYQLLKLMTKQLKKQ